MSWLFSAALVAAYSAGNSSAGAQSALLKTTPMPQVFWSPAKTTEVCPRFPSGVTFATLTEQDGEDVLMSFLGAFPVRTCRAREAEKDLAESGRGCGTKCCESSSKYAPAMSLSKTAPSYAAGVCTLSSTDLPKQGIMRHGRCWELPTSALRTSERECGFLPKRYAGMMWLTPMAKDGLRTKFKLESLVSHWKKHPRSNLAEQVALREMEKYRAEHGPHGGMLNPSWVDWLMGVPILWSGLQPLEMHKCRLWRQRHSGFLNTD